MKLPKELKELKNRLKLELDGCDVQESSIEVALLVVDEWYEEYQEDYEKLIVNAEDIERSTRNDGLESADTSIEKDADKKDEEYWRHWALQNIS